MFTFTTKYFLLILGFSAKWKIVLHFVLSRKLQNFAKKQIQKFLGKVENIAKKYGREIINYDIMQLLMLSFWAEYFRKSRQFFSYFNSWKNAKFREKVCKKRSKIFAFFLRKFSFAGNPIIQIRGHFLCKTISIRLTSWSGY